MKFSLVCGVQRVMPKGIPTDGIIPPNQSAEMLANCTAIEPEEERTISIWSYTISSDLRIHESEIPYIVMVI